MKRVFVQTSVFSSRLDARGRESLLDAVEQAILANPHAGDVVAGTGGVRKLRTADEHRQKGKRGGHRVLFLDLPDRHRTYLLYLYGKDESEDITAHQKRHIAALVSTLKKER